MVGTHRNTQYSTESMCLHWAIANAFLWTYAVRLHKEKREKRELLNPDASQPENVIFLRERN